MKNLITLILFLTSIKMYSQHSCCTMASLDDFSSKMKNSEFADFHKSPLPKALENNKGKMIKVKTKEGKDANVYEIKAENESNKYLLVFHEWWGLNNHIKMEAEKYYSEFEKKVTVLAVDVFDGRITANPDSARKQVEEVSKLRIGNILEGVIDYTGEGAEIGTIGWCFGGSISLHAALAAGEKAKACVIYYGMPVTDAEELKNLNAPVLGVFANQDKFITPEVVKKFEEAMFAAGKEIEIKFYDADHAFANPSNPHFNKEAGEDAYKSSSKFLKERLM